MSHEPTRIELFWECLTALPPIQFAPAPWGLAGSGIAVDAGQTRIRQEAGIGNWTDIGRGNARLICAAPTLYNASVEALCALVDLTDEHEATDEQRLTMTILVEMIAWIHNDPKHGTELRAALELDPLPPESAPKYAEPKPTKRARKTKTV